MRKEKGGGQGSNPLDLISEATRLKFKPKNKTQQSLRGPWRLELGAQEGFESPPSFNFAQEHE